MQKKIVLRLAALLIISSPVWAQSSAAEEAQAPTVKPKTEDSTNITLDFKEADVNTVLRVMSIKSKVNIVAGPEVQGTVTIRLENVPWEKALDVVLRTYDYVYERDGNIIRVTTRDKMQEEPVVTQTYILNYTKAAEIQSAVQDMLTERGRIKTSERTNAIVITDIPTNLYRMGEIIKQLDKITPQAYIDSKIVNTSLGVSETLGIDWNIQASLTGAARPVTFPFSQRTDTGTQDGDERPAVDDYAFMRQFFPIIIGDEGSPNTAEPRSFPYPAGSITDGSDAYTLGTLDFRNFQNILQMLRGRSSTKIVSNPRIVVLNNQTAKVQVGEQIPLPTFERNRTTGGVDVSGYTYRDVGVVLNVTPHINSAEEILVELNPEVSAQRATGVSFGSSFTLPAFTITQAKTQVLIRSGETIAIGGLLTDSVSITDEKVPYLGDLPLIGKLFRSKTQSSGSGNTKAETLFFVTVTTVDTEGQPSGERAEAKEKQRTGKTLREKLMESASGLNEGPSKAQEPIAKGQPSQESRGKAPASEESASVLTDEKSGQNSGAPTGQAASPPPSSSPSQP